MTFPINTTVPAAGNNPSVDQQPIQTNFANINSYLGVDHTSPGTNPGDGQHNQVTFHQNQAAPSIANGVSGLFANTTASGSELFFQNITRSIQMTNTSLLSQFGQGLVPGGMQIRAGVGNASTGGTANSIGPPFPTATLSVVVTSTSVSNIIFGVNGVSASSFTAICSSGVQTFYYIAIGY